jgi:hypothetical protein
MTYRGRVKKGVIVLDSPAQLPEGTEVEVRAPDQATGGDIWGEANSGDDDALISGSIASAAVVLPQEDFSDWDK